MVLSGSFVLRLLFCFRRCVALVSSLDVVVGLGLPRTVRFGGGLIEWWELRD